ncbi:putative PIF1 DNA helicase/replication protein A1-like protein [Senna tora]|uniref:ATP-dependent DNA helicase n=1 Tax=Senna tora TaxID=362788 RepID=A0A834WKY9_9FABA|nr:putative PIF1 DNA helicase/replication protein A1-like protein [Senna tora]
MLPKTRQDIVVLAALNSSYIWDTCKVLTLTKNMRLGSGNSDSKNQAISDFANWILNIGDGLIGDVQKGELTMRVKDEQVTFKMFNSIESPKENEKPLKVEAVKQGVTKSAVDGNMKENGIDLGEKSQKDLIEIDAADQFGGTTMLKAPS